MPYNNMILYYIFQILIASMGVVGVFFLMTLARLFANEAETVRHWIIILGLSAVDMARNLLHYSGAQKFFNIFCV